MNDCLFCKIALGTIKAELIHEDELTVAFLDICPIRPGHTQIVSRHHYPCFDDLPPLTASRIIHVGQSIGRAIKKIYQIDRVAFLFTGGDVAHAHAHVVPMLEKTDITSRQYIAEDKLTFRSTPQASFADLAETATVLRQILKASPHDFSISND